MATAASLNVVVVANTAQANAALAGLQKQLVATNATANTTTSTLGSKFAAASRMAATAAGGALAYGLYKGVKAGIDFEKQMDAVAAVSESTRKEQKKLEKQALDLGQATTFSANEVASAQEELVKGGLKVKDVLGGALKSSLNLAAAGNIELAEASATVVNAMKLFELRAKDAGAVADMFATAANRTTADVADFAMALRMGGSAAKAVGYDLNETVTVLEALAEAGIKNSDAGTSMKTAFLQLVAPTATQAAKAKELGLNLLTQNGELKNAAGLSMELQDALGGMSKSQVAANLKVLAGTDGFRTLLSLYDAGPQKLDALSRANAKQGTAQEIAKQKMDNTAGSLEQLSGAFETLSIKMFQSAQSPIRGFIDTLTVKLEEFTDIVTSKKLTTDEKISGVIDMISDSIKQAIPKIVAIGAQIGFALIKGIASAFWHGDILTKLFIGAAALKMFGGASALASLGKKIGLGIAGPMGIVIAAGLAGLSEENKITAALDKINKLVERPSIALANMFRVNPDIDTASLTDAIEKYQALGKVSEKAIWKWVESGKITAAQGQRLIEVLERVEKVGGDALIALGRSATKAGGMVKDFTSSGAKWLRDLSRGGERAMDDLGDSLKGPLVKALERAGDKVKDFTTDGAKWLRNLAKDADNSATKFERSMKKVGNSVTAAASVVTHGLGIIVDNTNKALKGFGVKKVAIPLAGAGAAASAFGQKKQRGGVMVGGSGSGDKVPLLAEPGEVVLNREAVRAIGGASKADRINKLFPRFQKGGKVGGGMSAMLALVNRYEQASYPYSWGGGHGGFPNGTQPVDCSGFVSDVLHAGGLLDSAPMVSGSLMNWGQQASGNEPLVVYANPVHTVMSLNGKVAGTSSSNPGGGAGWIQGGNGASLAAGAKRTMDVVGGVLTQIKRLLVKGPDGPIKDIAQGSLDKARNAANSYIESMMPSGNLGGGQPLKDLPRALEKYNQTYPEAPAPSHLSAYHMPFDAVAAVGEWAGMPGISMAKTAIGESALAPGASGIDPGGTKGLGLWMITTGFNDALIAKYGGQKQMFNPIVNAQAAKTIFDSQGIGAWYSQTADSSNTHYSGPLLRQAGGLIPASVLAAARPSPWGDIPDLGGDGGAGHGPSDRGGILSLTKTIKRLLAEGPTKGKAGEKYDDTKHDKGVVEKARKRLRALVETKNYPTTSDGGELAGKVAEMREEADKYSEWAGNASLIGGEYKGKTEVGWFREQLVALLKLRNLLIAAEKEMEKQARRVAELEHDAQKRLREFERKTRIGEKLLGKKGKTPHDWDDKDEDPASIDVAKWNKLEDKKRKALMHKFERHHGRLPGDRLFSGDAKLITPESKPGAFPNVGGWQQVAGFLKNTVLGTLKGSDGIEGAMAATMDTLKTELQGVAGTGSGMQRVRPADYVDKIGRFGGEILDAQTSIRDIEASSGPQPIDISGLRELIEAARYGVFDGLPRFHSGGVVPGRATDEVPIMARGGEVVVSEPGGVNVVNNFSWDGFDLVVDTTINDKFAKQERFERRRGRQAVR